jgi:hypothetical protein
MESADQFQRHRRKLTRDEFIRQFAHPFLLRELDADERAPSTYNTVYDAKDALDEAARLGERGPALSVRLKLEPGRYGVYSLVKSGANPWRDRVTVGRATNNDIVLRPGSVSKLHAYFENLPERGWSIFDCKSANGTRLDSHPLEPGEARRIASGALIHFGAVLCEFIEAGPLYDVL